MPRSTVTAPDAAAIGPYSHAAAGKNLVFLSGQTPVVVSTGKLVDGSVADQTRQCFANLFAVLNAAGLNEKDVVKVQVYLTDMQDFDAMNAVYAEQFTTPYPARTTIGVASLPLDAKVEIEMIAESGARE